MARKPAMALALCAVPTILAGCGSVAGGKRIDVRLRDDMVMRSANADPGASELSAGRRALDAGLTSDAITAFRTARLYPEHAAAAYNGLAVAYSRLGRADLTERYFRQAVALAPDEARYQANLARFLGREMPTPVRDAAPLLAQATVAAPSSSVMLAASQSAPRAVQVGNGVIAIAPRSQIIRVSRNEVRIGAEPAKAAPARAARVQFARNDSRPAYPVRIAIPARNAASDVSAPVYPVRILVGQGRR